MSGPAPEAREWLEQAGFTVKQEPMWLAALTHGSLGESTNYERLEFLGDRVLGHVMARTLYDKHPDEPEGFLSRRYNVLVARETCADIGRELGVPAIVRLGKQAREDHANMSENVLGDVVEALLGAIYIDSGLDYAEAFIKLHWKPFIEGQKKAPVHPKSALQELAAARNLGTPRYETLGRAGPPHAPRFRVQVTLGRHGEAEAEGSSKQEAETAAAAALLEKLGRSS